MVECQVCGKPAAGEGFVEGTKVPLCESCSAYASNFAFYKEYQYFLNERKFSKPSYSQKPLPQKPVSKDGELAEDFGKRIMKARERQSLSRKDLARKILIQEKELEGFE